MTYQELLESEEWQERRKVILKRDSFKCQSCGNSKILNELSVGLFENKATTKVGDIVKITPFSDEISVIAQVNNEVSAYLTKSSLLYYGRTPKGRNKIYGIRKLVLPEYEIFKSYFTSKKEIFQNVSSESLNESVKKLMDLKKQLAMDLKNAEPSFSEFEWKIMIGLHIHHKYYIKSKLPWEYKDDALTTLCMTCHEELHKNQKVPIYDNNYELIGQLTNCHRCYGAGWFPEYLKVENGICFRCRGAKYEEITNGNNAYT